MAQLENRLLTESELATGLATLDGWTVEDGKLVKSFEFKTYKDGLVFAVAVGYLADQLDHHPDLEVGYAKVKVGVNTHSVGGLSPLDIELAKKVEVLGA
jgi:4a-hydroxytetrahydrobiopterin dehydratase